MNEKIRILHVVYSFNVGGLENGLVNLMNHLPPERFSHMVCVLATGKKCAERVRVPVIYYELGKRDGNDPSIPFRIAAIVRKEAIDIVHTRNWVALLEGFAGGLMGGCCRLIHSEHGKEVEDTRKQPARRRIAKRVCFSLARQIITVSDSLRREFIHDRLCRESEITCIINGVDCDRFQPASPEHKAKLRNRFGIPENAFVAGSVGRLAEIKNYDLMLSLCKQMEAENSFFVLAGDGPERERLTQEAVRLGVADRFRFTGELSDIPDFLNALDVFLNTSHYEGISNTILEAMASGLPVLVNNTGGNPEIVRNGINGFLIDGNREADFLTHLRRLNQDTAFRERLSEDAVQYTRRNYSLDAMVSQYGRIYTRASGK